jgi:hypothetical protein
MYNSTHKIPTNIKHLICFHGIYIYIYNIDIFLFPKQNKQDVHCNPTRWTTKLLHSNLHQLLVMTKEISPH